MGGHTDRHVEAWPECSPPLLPGMRRHVHQVGGGTATTSTRCSERSSCTDLDLLQGARRQSFAWTMATEFRKAVVAALLEQFGVVVKTGSIRHPQSQGGVERLNRTIIGLLRKALEETSDWTSELELVLFYYNRRRHATTGISPRLAITGWEGRGQVIDHDPTAYSASEWVDRLAGSAARIRDLVDSLLSSNDSVSGGPT